jgi:hypothetical protein
MHTRTKWLLCLALLLVVNVVFAQCPMCRMSAETNLKDGGTEAAGLNQGIIYLLTLPYLLMGTLGYLWYKNHLVVREGEMLQEVKNLLEPLEGDLT